MKYDILQINLTDAQIDEVNSAKDGLPIFYKKYLQTTFKPQKESIVDAYDMYALVASIEAEDLEDVFRIGNIGPEENITRYEPMHSLSVGDIVVDVETGLGYYVDSFGFGELGKMNFRTRMKDVA